MPIESLIMADSQNAVHNEGWTGGRDRVVLSSQTAGSIAQGVYDKLIEVGWTANGGSKATFSLVLNNGVPWVRTVPDPPISPKPVIKIGIHLLTIDGVEVHFFDPYRYTAPIGDGRIWLEMGLTHGLSLTQLAGIVSFFGWVHVATWQQQNVPYGGWYHLDYEAPVIGFEWNDVAFGGTKKVRGASNAVGFFSFIWPKYPSGSEIYVASGTGPAGGGKIARSEQDAGTLDVAIFVSPFVPQLATFQMYASTGAVSANWQVNHAYSSDTFTLIANQFQFLIFPEISPFSNAGQQTLLVTFPKMASSKGVSYACIIAGRGAFRKQMQWASAGTRSQVALNSGAFTRTLGIGEYAGVAPGLYPVKYRHELTTPGGTQIAETAYLGAPLDDASQDDATDQARIIGWLWDALIRHGWYTLDTRGLIGEYLYQCVGNEYTYYGSKVSLWIAYREVL